MGNNKPNDGASTLLAGYGKPGNALHKPATKWAHKPLPLATRGLIACQRVNGTICPKAATHVAGPGGATLCGLSTRTPSVGHAHYGLNWVAVATPNAAGLCARCAAANVPLAAKVVTAANKAATPAPATASAPAA